MHVPQGLKYGVRSKEEEEEEEEKTSVLVARKKKSLETRCHEVILECLFSGTIAQEKRNSNKNKNKNTRKGSQE
ncbi:uncharacterized protein MEPE_03985 [Melanopsichium pennsylvanicum]|uniref:Uncharacterized protein n=1 Tax=Melanopsichium pennsylvanicum TaxID=63383 RepID=A0AAJ5C601_9BASI|nr:uncharacterized protein MEPE_03985 [Melanopsichium pennsylvanicum]